jgi:hypothetical protein
MGNSLIKADTREEARRQMLMVDQSLANTITRRLEIEERKHELNAKLRESKEYQELRMLSKEDKELIIAQHEKNGARKMIFGLLKKFGMDVPNTKLTKLIDRNQRAGELVQVQG